MRVTILLLYLLVSHALSAQQPISQSLKTSTYRYIYKVSANEALTLYKANLNKINEQYLHTYIDSFPVQDNMPQLPNGNYILLQATGNKLKYELITSGDLQLKLVNNKRDLAIMLHDKKGKSIDGAVVNLDGRELKFDVSTQTYRLNKKRKSGGLQVRYANTMYYFPIRADGRRQGNARVIIQRALNGFPLKYITKTIGRWRGRSNSYIQYFSQPVPNEANYRGFMSFNKPIYKPGDTVRLKAFVMDKKGRGVSEKLLVRLTDRYFDFDTIIAVVKPYRDGGFIHEFVLNDSLDLDLDSDYLITLEEQRSRKYDLNTYDGDLDDDEYAAKRKVVMRGKFTYEEYELGTINFTARMDQKEHNRGEKLSIFLKAADENDLPVMDGRLQITVLPSLNNGLIFHKSTLFLPDTLWTHTQALESVGETKINIPDSVFPDASFNYQIECVLLNSNNERHTQNLYASFINTNDRITFDLKKDSLSVDFLTKGTPAKAPAVIYIFNDQDDTLQIITTTLPATLKLNPFASHYKAISLNSTQDYRLKYTKGIVSALATRTKDSLFIRLNNPHVLPVWYTLFAGNKVIDRGHADSLSLSTKTQTANNYTLSIQYVFGNKMYTEDYIIPYQDKLLKLTVNSPLVVYPGQKTTIEIGVTDANNKSVEGADVTAYSFTKKFTNPKPPYVPYLGKTYRNRRIGSTFRIQPDKDWTHLSKLNWVYWSKEMGLDTLEYYKFLYPNQLYWNKEAVKDSSTQIAPFVVLKGELQPIHLLYIDEKPHYFSKSQHLQRYSFKVNPGKHSLRIRTHDRIITLKDITIEKGFKTILSIDGDTSNKYITVQKAPDTLTIQEKILLTKYTILVNSNYGERFSYVTQGDNYLLLPKYPHQSSNAVAVVGPLMPDMAELVVKDEFKQAFEVEGGYLYQISQGLIKQKQVNTSSYIGKWLSAQAPAYNFSDFVLTGKEIDSLWKDYLDKRSFSSDLFINPPINKMGNGRLQIVIQNTNRDSNVFVKNHFLFRYDNTDFIRVYKGSSYDLGYLAPGYYRLLILLKDDYYIVKDSIYVQKNGLNYYSIDSKGAKPADSISRRLADVIKTRELSNSGTTYGLDQIKESFNSSFLDVSSFKKVIVGRLVDNEGNPIPAATVKIKGTRYGTLTDASGYYKIQAPDKGTLVFQSVGYSSIEQNIVEGFMNVVLARGEANLQEVVVTGYGITRKQSLSASISVVNELSGRAPGVTIRSAQTIQAGVTPLIIVDGIPYDGSLNDLDPALLSGVTTMKGDAAQALYGSRGANGVILITTRKGNVDLPIAEGGGSGSIHSLRRRFRDDAYWQPTLKTNADGKARFTITFPDDITNWRTYAIAIDDHKRTGYAEGMIRSFKPISANLSLPQFAIEGDSLNVIGKTLNYGTESLRVTRRFTVNDQLVKEGVLNIQNAHVDTVSLTVEERDSVRIQLAVQKEDGYFDGEERSIPVYKQGVLETKGVFAALEGDTIINLQLDPSLGKVTLYAEASLFPVLLDEIEKIRTYEYLCNEQLASKLKALLSQKKIYRLLKRDFERDKAILDIIAKLNNNKTGNLWGWWSNNEPAPWISLHVVEALLEAEREGYKVNMSKTGIIDNLVFNMENYRSSDKLLSLHLLQRLNAKVNYKNYLDSLDRRIDKMAFYDRLRLIEIKQKVGIDAPLDSLVAKAKHTLFGNVYWGEEGYQFFDNAIQNTLLMYRILKAGQNRETVLRKIRNYFLEKRKDGQWRNTYESSLILETILPDLLVSGEKARSATLSISTEGGNVITNFPYQKEFSSKEPIVVRKEGDLPIYFTAFQQSWNRAPAAAAGAFVVTTTFDKSGEVTTSLKAGEPVNLKVNVTVKGDADYVMIEIPIPAGCSYKEKPQPRSNNEVHREYFKNKVSLFCSGLKQGSYTFTIPLLPRYSGTFYLNPAKAEMMYFPIFYGREGIKQISIK
jgi:TonB-dependent SusC/RagA subfamily outer membrane receptor